jgi:hypothetical protein
MQNRLVAKDVGSELAKLCLSASMLHDVLNVKPMNAMLAVSFACHTLPASFAGSDFVELRAHEASLKLEWIRHLWTYALDSDSTDLLSDLPLIPTTGGVLCKWRTGSCVLDGHKFGSELVRLLPKLGCHLLDPSFQDLTKIHGHIQPSTLSGLNVALKLGLAAGRSDIGPTEGTECPDAEVIRREFSRLLATADMTLELRDGLIVEDFQATLKRVKIHSLYGIPELRGDVAACLLPPAGVDVDFLTSDFLVVADCDHALYKFMGNLVCTASRFYREYMLPAARSKEQPTWHRGLTPHALSCASQFSHWCQPSRFCFCSGYCYAE